MTWRSEIGFLTLLRGPAALCVVWAHYAGLSEHILGDSWCLLAWVRRYIDKPLLTHDFGFLGVAIFFLISGFIITHVAQSEKRFEFLVKRILRIYPAFWFSLNSLLQNFRNFVAYQFWIFVFNFSVSFCMFVLHIYKRAPIKSGLKFKFILFCLPLFPRPLHCLPAFYLLFYNLLVVLIKVLSILQVLLQ